MASNRALGNPSNLDDRAKISDAASSAAGSRTRPPNSTRSAKSNRLASDSNAGNSGPSPKMISFHSRWLAAHRANARSIAQNPSPGSASHADHAF